MKFVTAMALAALVAFPQGVNAQDGEEGGSALERWHPEAFVDPASKATPSEPPSEGPALQLELDSAGVEVVPSLPRTVDGYTLEEMELRVRRTKIGLGVSAGVFLGGGVMIGAAFSNAGLSYLGSDPDPAWVAPVYAIGGLLMLGGIVGMIASARILRHGKIELRELQEAHYRRPRRVQWDLARSRLVF